VNYAKLLEMSFLTCQFFFRITYHIFLEIGKAQDLPSKIWQAGGDALKCYYCFVSSWERQGH
jgi:hypothetical protein